jgi:Flp pilus assembly protein TadG
MVTKDIPQTGLREKGQTTIETVMLLLLLFAIFFTIVELSRAWWVKNTLNNAARIGARVAVVQSDLVNDSDVACGGGGLQDAIDAVCNAPGVPIGARVSVSYDDANSDGDPSAGETVTVSVEVDFSAVSILSIVPSMGNITEISSLASMRYELN